MHLLAITTVTATGFRASVYFLDGIEISAGEYAAVCFAAFDRDAA